MREAFERLGLSWTVVKTMEKELDPVEIGKLHPGLYEYLLQGNRQGFVELEKRLDRYYYPVWFYRVVY